MAAMARLLVFLSVAEAAVHRGFLYDKLCVDRGVGIDGVDTRTEPERHTVHCLLVSVCKNSGYGILSKKDGQSQYSMEVLLSDRGNMDVVTWLGTQEYWGSNVNVEISGSYDSQGQLHVGTIKRLSDGSVWNGSAGATEASTSRTKISPVISTTSDTPSSGTTSDTPSTGTTSDTSTSTVAGDASETATSAALTTSAASCAHVLLATALVLFFRL